MSYKHETVEKMIHLFDKHREAFGLCNHTFPNYNYEEEQCIFEEEFAKLVCEYRKGHDFIPDMCGKPEHDFCTVCGQSREQLEDKE